MRFKYETRSAAILSATAIGLGSLLTGCSNENPSLPSPTSLEREQGQTDCTGLLSKASLRGIFKGLYAYSPDKGHQYSLCVPISNPVNHEIIERIYPQNVRAVVGPPIFACAIGQRVFAAASRETAESPNTPPILVPEEWGVLSTIPELTSQVTPCPVSVPGRGVPAPCPIPGKENYATFEIECFPADPATKA